jgi:hypothetical protein
VTFFGLILLTLVLVRYLIYGSPVPGFSFLASAIAIFSGAQLVTLGIFGEYLARVHVRMMDKPTYTIRGAVDHPTTRGSARPASDDQERTPGGERHAALENQSALGVEN